MGTGVCVSQVKQDDIVIVTEFVAHTGLTAYILCPQ